MCFFDKGIAQGNWQVVRASKIAFIENSLWESTMKKLSLLVVAAFGATLLAPKFMVPTSHANRQDADPKAAAVKVETSLKAWKKAKAKSEGNYTYTVANSSFTGARWVTTVVVRGNKVVMRKYEVFGGRPRLIAPGQKPGKVEQKPKWVEKGKDVGTHKEGASPSTVDELYVEAKKVVESKLNPHQRLYVGFDKNGILKHCFYVDTRIADDAPTIGPRISTLKMEKGD